MRSESAQHELRGRDRKDLSKSDQIRREGSVPNQSQDSGGAWWLDLLTKKTRKAVEAYERKA
jgi:hypothetical protein